MPYLNITFSKIPIKENGKPYKLVVSSSTLNIFLKKKKKKSHIIESRPYTRSNLCNPNPHNLALLVTKN